MSYNVIADRNNDSDDGADDCQSVYDVLSPSYVM